MALQAVLTGGPAKFWPKHRYGEEGDFWSHRRAIFLIARNNTAEKWLLTFRQKPKFPPPSDHEHPFPSAILGEQVMKIVGVFNSQLVRNAHIR